MKLHEKIKEEVELADFYVDRNGAVNIMKIVRDYIIVHAWDTDDVVHLLNMEITKAGGKVL